MKGRYNDCVINVYCTMPGYKRLASAPKLSKKARQRLKWFDYYDSHNHNARLTSRYFGIYPQTFYRWKERYDPKHIESLEDLLHRPKHLRQPAYSPELIEAVLGLRETYPRWGKDKLVILLHREGFTCSGSTAGRILKKLKERGVLKELLPNHISARKSQRQRPYAVRKPEDYVAREPRDMVVAMEATLGWYWLHDLLEEKGIEVKLSHPLKTKAIASARIKNDKIDSKVLAHL